MQENSRQELKQFFTMSKIKLKLQMVAKTHVGKVRDHNEDNFIVTDNNSEQWLLPKGIYYNSAKGTIMAIADGMGGLNAGEIASKITVETISKYFDNVTKTESEIREHLIESILLAHQSILEYSKINTDTEGMGTTAVVAHITDDTINVAWSGDSRCYLFRDNSLSQLSKDHSYVQDLVEEGKITKEQAFYHPNSNMITQSLGDEKHPPEPDFISGKLYQDDIVLLCSDGLNSMITDETIEKILVEHAEDLNNCIEELLLAANEAGGNDNITIILNKVIEGDRYYTNPKPFNDEYPTIRTQKSNMSVYVLVCLVGILGAFIWYFRETIFLQKEVTTPKPTSTTVIPHSSSKKEELKQPDKNKTNKGQESNADPKKISDTTSTPKITPVHPSQNDDNNKLTPVPPKEEIPFELKSLKNEINGGADKRKEKNIPSNKQSSYKQI